MHLKKKINMLLDNYAPLKTKASSVPTVLSRENGDTITNPYDIANTFNNYFVSLAETAKRSIKY